MAGGIYFKEETREVIKRIKEREPDFNVSGFLKKSLMNYNGEGEDISVLKENMLEWEEEIKVLQQKIKKSKLLVEEKERQDLERKRLEKSKKGLIRRWGIEEEEYVYIQKIIDLPSKPLILFRENFKKKFPRSKLDSIAFIKLIRKLKNE